MCVYICLVIQGLCAVARVSILSGIPNNLLHRRQIIPNSAARISTCSRSTGRVTPLLIQLHWLPAAHRIQFKTLLLTLNALRNPAPTYLTDLSENYTPPRLPPSSPAVPDRNFSTTGGRTFSRIAPQLWNPLPHHIHNWESISGLGSSLKTRLVRLAYSPWHGHVVRNDDAFECFVSRICEVTFGVMKVYYYYYYYHHLMRSSLPIFWKVRRLIAQRPRPLEVSIQTWTLSSPIRVHWRWTVLMAIWITVWNAPRPADARFQIIVIGSLLFSRVTAELLLHDDARHPDDKWLMGHVYHFHLTHINPMECWHVPEWIPFIYTHTPCVESAVVCFVTY